MRRRSVVLVGVALVAALSVWTAPSSVSADPSYGSISGTVRGPDGQPLGPASGMCVKAGTQDWSELEPDGTYLIDGLPPDSYGVSFSPCHYGDSVDYAPEFYPNLHSPDAAESGQLPNVVVVAGQTTSGIDAQLELAGGLALTIVDGGGNPRDDLCVTAWASRERAVRHTVGRFGQSFYARTGADGLAELTGLPPDSYTYEVRVCDHLEQLDLTRVQFSGGGFTRSGAVPVQVQDGQVRAQAVEMAAGAVLTGTVTHEGEPWTNAGVGYSTSRYGVWCAPVEPDGTYRIEGLVPEPVYVVACDMSDPMVRVQPTWFPDAASSFTASAVALQAGQTWSADLELKPKGYSRSFIITGLPSSTAPGCGVRVRSTEGATWTVPIRPADTPGVYVADAAAPDTGIEIYAQLWCNGQRAGISQEATDATPQFNRQWHSSNGGYPSNQVDHIRYDVSGPVITPSQDPATMPWSPVPVTISFSCSDSGSGVASCPAPVTYGEGQSSWVSATDRDGHVTWLHVAPRIDTAPPVIQITGNGRTFRRDEPMQFACDVWDERSGVGGSNRYVCPEWGALGSSLGEGTHTFVIGAVDWAGNVTQPVVATVTIVK